MVRTSHRLPFPPRSPHSPRTSQERTERAKWHPRWSTVRLQYRPRNIHGSHEIGSAVRLGNSGLKVSKIILGCMSYGDPGWQQWVLGEEEGIKQIKFA